MPVYREINKNFFKTWSSNMAYVLGFFATDGYITHNKRDSHFFCFQITDKELLESIRFVLGSSHTISVRVSNKSHKTIYRLQIGSKEMCRDLEALGMFPKKTHTMPLTYVPNEFLGDFARGYFDGDGNVWSGLVHKERKTSHKVLFLAFTSCSKQFLLSFQERLLGAGMGSGSLHSPKNESYFRLSYSTTAALQFYDFVYNRDCKLFLERKKKVFEKFKKYKMQT